jgi:hypothetical protein
MPRWFHTHLVGLNGPQESDHYYLADAEVALALEVREGPTWFGKRLRFRLPSSDVIWCGHLDDGDPAPGKGWPRETGDARLCLHDLHLRPNELPPLGYPFKIGDPLVILSEDGEIGTCTITQIFDYRSQKVSVARPLG